MTRDKVWLAKSVWNFSVERMVNFERSYEQPRMKDRSKTLEKHSMFRRRYNAIKGKKDISRIYN